MSIILTTLCILRMLSSTSHAYTYDEVVDFLSYANVNQTDTTLKNTVTWFLNNQSIVNSQLNTLGINKNNYNCILIDNPTSSLVKCRIVFIAYNGTGSYYCNSNKTITYNNYGSGYVVDIWQSGYNPSKTSKTFNGQQEGKTGLLMTEPTNNNYYNMVLNNYWVDPVPALNFDPSGLAINFNNQNPTYANKYNYSVIQWSLGYLRQFSDYYEIQIRLKDENQINYGTVFKNDYTWYNSKLVLNTDGNVLMRSSSLYYNKLYDLEFTIYHDRNTYYVYDYYFLFLPMNAVITNGVITSSGSGDFVLQDNTNNIVDSVDNSTNDIISALTSTQLDSGDDWSSGDFPLYTVDDPTINFFDYLLNRVTTLFTDNDTVSINLNIPYLTNGSYVLSSDFFQLVDYSPILYIFFNSIFLIIFLKPKINDLHEIIKAMQMGYTDTFINYFGYGISIDDLL